jgi:DNA-binding XRE family transcriptional regulator
MDGGWKEKRNDDAMGQVLSETDGRREDAGARGARAGEPASGSADREAARAEERLSQTKLAALAEMSAPKISAMENEPRNLTIGTLIRVAHALDSRVEIKLVRRKGTKAGRRRTGGGKVKTRGL